MPEEIEPDDDAGEDALDNGGGVFGQRGDIFNRTPESPVNPQVTRAQEQVPENMPGSPAPEPRRDLVFAQDALGRTTVAWAVNGNLVEAFRQPTAEELKLAPQARWRAVPPPVKAPPPGAPPPPAAMGMFPIGQTAPAPQPAPAPAATGGSVLGTLVKLALLGGVAYGGYKAWEYYKEHEDDATDEELDEADDVQEEVVA